MPRLANPLQDAQIQSALTDPNAPRQLTDGGSGGLYLKLRASKEGLAQWRFDFKSPTTGKRDTLLLGFYGKGGDRVTLGDARKKAREALAMIARGECPGEARKGAKKAAKTSQERATAIAKGDGAPGTFKGEAKAYHAGRYREEPTPGFKNKIGHGHAKKWIRAMETYAFPVIGDMHMGEVQPEHILKVLEPIEQAGHKQMALCVRVYIGKVFKVARVKRLCTMNPASLDELGDAIPKRPKSKPLASQVTPKGAQMVMQRISACLDETKRDCLTMMALTWQRPGNVRAMRWADLDLEDGLWTISSLDLKRKIEDKETGEAHIVPLSRQAVKLLQKRQAANPDGCPWVFQAAQKKSLCIGQSTISREMEALGLRTKGKGALMTPHGFRAMGRTMLREQHGFHRDVLEAHLAHSNGEANGDSYDRATHLTERTKALQVWADYLDTLTGSNVKTLQRAA